MIQVEPGNAVKNYSKKPKQTTAVVLQPTGNGASTTNAANMVGQILMPPTTNITQIDLGKTNTTSMTKPFRAVLRISS